MFAVQALTESLNSFLMGDHPSGLKLLTLKFLLVLITVSILLLFPFESLQSLVLSKQGKKYSLIYAQTPQPQLEQNVDNTLNSYYGSMNLFSFIQLFQQRTITISYYNEILSVALFISESHKWHEYLISKGIH